MAIVRRCRGLIILGGHSRMHSSAPICLAHSISVPSKIQKSVGRVHPGCVVTIQNLKTSARASESVDRPIFSGIRVGMCTNRIEGSSVCSPRLTARHVSRRCSFRPDQTFFPTEGCPTCEAHPLWVKCVAKTSLHGFWIFFASGKKRHKNTARHPFGQKTKCGSCQAESSTKTVFRIKTVHPNRCLAPKLQGEKISSGVCRPVAPLLRLYP